MSSTAMHATAGLCARAALLSSLLSAPADPATLCQVRDDAFAGQWERSSPEARRGLALLRESANAQEDEERLAADFTRLFEGEERRIDPRESAYRPEADLVELAATYEAAGFAAPFELPLDHLATELLFAARLPDAAPRPARALAGFAHAHLRLWASECLAEVSLRASSLFYQGVGTLGMDYIESLPTR